MATELPGGLIDAIEPGSLAEEAGLLPGSRLVGVNGEAPLDVLDYQFAEGDEEVELTVLTPAGECETIAFSKDPGEPLGLAFASPVFDGVRRCNNACTFCFCNQLPRGLRPSLYVRDDDYRLSFLQGTFITLTNLTESDFARIERFRLSPLYVSVQAVTPSVRRQLMRGRHCDEVLPRLDRLLAAGTELHTQVVLVPGVNDGVELDRTVAELSRRQPGVASIGLVPVGLTAHRPRGDQINSFSPELARSLLARVRHWQLGFLTASGSRLVYAADELYLRAGQEVPPAADYEDYPQLENGIGLTRLFLDDLAALATSPPVLPSDFPNRLALVTGVAATPLLEQFTHWLRGYASVEVDVITVTNRLLGPTVTVAGLLAGADIAAATEGHPADALVVPAAAVNNDGLFLDDLRVSDLANLSNCPVVPAGPLPSSVLSILSDLHA